MNKDFGDGAPLVLGSIRGKRVWRVALSGDRIESPTYKDFYWDDGEMNSRCAFPGATTINYRNKILSNLWIPEGMQYDGYEVGSGVLRIKWYAALGTDSGLLPEKSIWPNIEYEIEHHALSYYPFVRRTLRGSTIINSPSAQRDFFADLQMADTTTPETHLDYCSCGFYAYFDGEKNVFAGVLTSVAGVIEGYGETLIGTKGFRSMKSRIVALAPYSLPEYGGISRRERNQMVEWLRKHYPDVPVYKSERKMYRKHPLSKAKEFAT